MYYYKVCVAVKEVKKKKKMAKKSIFSRRIWMNIVYLEGKSVYNEKKQNKKTKI